MRLGSAPDEECVVFNCKPNNNPQVHGVYQRPDTALVFWGMDISPQHRGLFGCNFFFNKENGVAMLT